MVAVRQQLVQGNNRLVSKGTNTRKSITIHETGNAGRGANAAAHANLQSRGNGRNASWHYQVDDKEVVQSYAHTDRTWHSGTTQGNNTSIAIEICVNADGNFEQALQNAAELTRQIMGAESIPISQVFRHSKWSGKNCPARIRGGAFAGWNGFIARVLQQPVPNNPAPAPASAPSTGGKSISQLADEVMRGIHGTGAARQRSLGSQYAAVQAEVNRRLGAGSSPAPAAKSISQLADEVMRGQHGTGDARRRSLGANYNAVQAEVNRRLGAGGSAPAAPARKSVAQIATEVIAGQWGNGATRRQRLTAAGYNYNAVQAEVNRRVG